VAALVQGPSRPMANPCQRNGVAVPTVVTAHCTPAVARSVWLVGGLPSDEIGGESVVKGRWKLLGAGAHQKGVVSVRGGGDGGRRRPGSCGLWWR
jgi:hypothetical protein